MTVAEPAPAQSDSEGKPLLDPKWHRPLSINRRTAPHFAMMQNIDAMLALLRHACDQWRKPHCAQTASLCAA